jgi:DNA-binding LacI/PurR family transcriptional regulator
LTASRRASGHNRLVEPTDPVSNQRRRTVRLEDVAYRAGVDVSTVSRALQPNSDRPVRAETRERVLRIAEELGYRPNAIARSLKLETTGTLGLLVPTLRNPVLADLIHGAFREAWQHERVLLVAEDNEGEAGDAYERLARSGRIDGLLIASTRIGRSDHAAFLEDGLPCVFVNRRRPGSGRNVSMGDDEAGRIAARHLLESGHSQIGHLAGPADLDTARRRTEGFVEVLAEAGVEATQVGADFAVAGGALGAKELLEIARPRPTAVFVSNVQQAVGAVSALRSLGLRIPEDVALVTCDDDPLLEYLEVPVTSIRMPLAELGAAAVGSLLEQIDGGAPQDVLIAAPPRLIVRASSGAPHDDSDQAPSSP